MEQINRMITNICSDKLEQSKIFYTTLLNFEVVFDSDWYLQLRSKEKNFELGIIDSSSEVVPPGLNNPDGVYLTFVVDSADNVYQIAKTHDFEIIQAPEDTFYGQRRLLLKDPNGCSIDVSSLIKT